MKKLLLLFFVTLIICVACNTKGSSLVCGENRSNISLYFQLGSGLVYNNICPDTLLPDKPFGHVINPFEQIVIINMDANEWQAYFKGGGDTTCIFIIERDTLSKYDWKDVRENYRILKRYDLSIKDLTILENSRGIPVIVYPPYEIMKGMKMYPPYEQK